MPYVVVDNFSGGLDSRRHVLNSKTGTMSVLKNAHITRGGEIEKRKAFVHLADLDTLSADTFGLEATADGLYVFGSQPAPATMPAGIIYQRLQHPEYPSDMYMSKVVFSTVYGGKPFVIAEFEYNSPGPRILTNRVAFYDGAAIKDFHEGYEFKDSALSEFLLKFESYIAGKYTAAHDYSTHLDLLITGPIGKSFTATASVPAGISATSVNTQTHVEPKSETTSKCSFTISGGLISPASANKFGRFLDAASLPGIRSIRVGASTPSSANGLDLIGWSSPTGLKFNTVTPTESTGTTGGALYWNIRKAINDNTSSGIDHGYSSRWVIQGGSVPATNYLFIEASPDQGSIPNGFIVQIEFDSNPTGVSGLSELVDVSTIAVSPYDPAKYIATFGVLQGGVFSRINSVKVSGVEILGAPVSWNTSNEITAAIIAGQINAYTSVPDYTATANSAGEVTISALPGTGSLPNGRAITLVTEGNVTIAATSFVFFRGGVDAVVGLPQITRIRYTPDIAVLNKGDKLSITIIDSDNPTVPLIYGASRVVGKNVNFSFTYKAKEYVGSGSTLFFSAINDATKWDIYDTGSGFIDMSNNFGGREDLTGAGLYHNLLAVFSRRNIQLWSMDADPAQNSQVQVLSNTGAIAPDSIVSVGSIDLLYLADNGVRSVRARENTDTAYASDIGSPVDSIIIDHMAAIGDLKYNAKAVIEPIDGRYWLAIGSKIFVLSYFPGSNISAWSQYDPGFTVSDMVARDDKVYVRDTEDNVYVFGGTNGSVYDDCEVVIELPYLDANKPATYKEVKGIDMTCNGEWKVYLGFDHTNPTARDLVATVTQSTFALGKIPATGAGTHFGPRFVHEADGPALLANFIVHFDDMHSKHDAG